MTVQKFRTIEEMNKAAEATPRQSGIERFLRHCARMRALHPRVYPRGVVKFRSIEQARHPDR